MPERTLLCFAVLRPDLSSRALSGIPHTLNGRILPMGENVGDELDNRSNSGEASCCARRPASFYRSEKLPLKQRKLEWAPG